MRKSEFRREIRLDLQDLDPSSPKFSDDIVDRSVERAVSDCDRILPREAIYEVELSLDIAGEAFNSGTLGVAVSLANSYLEPESEVATNVAGTVTYTRGTDYTMDFYNGTITCLVGGLIPAATACKVSYSKSDLGVDISAIHDLTRILRVEYPMGKVPQEFVSWQKFGDFLTITSGPTGSQARLSSGNRLGIYYHCTNDRPSDASDGSLPAIFEEVIVKGSAVYLMQSQSVGQLLEAADNLGLAQTSLDSSATAITLAATALAGIDGYLTSAGTAFGKVGDSVTDGKAALALIAAKIVLAEYAMNEATTYVDLISAGLTACLGAWSDALKYVEGSGGILGAQPHLEVGDDLINQVTVGLNPAQVRREYAETEVAIAKVFQSQQDTWLLAVDKRNYQLAHCMQKSAQEIELISNFIQQALRHSDFATAFNQEGLGRIRMAETLINQAQVHIQRAQIYIANAERYENTSVRNLDLATKYRETSESLKVEYLSLLKDRAQWKQEISTSARSQSSR